MQELKEAVCKKLKKDNNLEYTPAQIVVSSGAKSSLYHAICAIVEEGHEVIIPAPYWLTYPELVKLAGGKCVYVETAKENGYKITAEQLKNAITDKTTCIILNSPNNPTGALYSKQELIELAKVIEEKQINVVSDEIYEKLVYDEQEFYSIAQYSEYLKEHTVVVNGMSKSYSMTGWRIGYLAAPLKIAKAISSMQSHTTSNPCSIAQYASVTALTNSESDNFIENMKRIFDERRKFMVESLKQIPEIQVVTPQGAFYVFVNVSNLYGKKYKDREITGSLSFADCLLEAGVALIPGIAFGDDDSVRLSYCVSLDDIKEGVDRLKKFISEVK